MIDTEICQWLERVQPGLLPAIRLWCQLKTGKRGCLYLKGPANCGKSLLVRLIAAYFGYEHCGLVSRCEENRFWLQGILDKRLVIAEEFNCTDIQADQLKLHFEGSPFAQVEIKNQSAVKLKRRQPWVVSTNFEITGMCPRHCHAIEERLIRVTFSQPDPMIKQIAEVIYSLDEDHLRQIAIRLFAHPEMFALEEMTI